MIILSFTIMHTAINFNNDAGINTTKIGNIIADYPLPIKI